jgi:hypothetical protein
MGIGRWVRRILGRAEGGVPCHLCRCVVPPVDIEKGVAVVIARQQYCKRCIEEITYRAKNREAGWNLCDLGSSSTIFLR